MADANERMSWSVADDDLHDELAGMMGLRPEERDLLAELQDVAAEQADAMTDDFYDRLLAHDNTAEYFENIDMDRQHEAIAEWFVELFGGVYDAEYVAGRLEIGHIHVRIGLPVRYPLSMIDIIMQHGEAVVAESSDPETAKEAFEKVMALDIAVFNQAYENQQLEHLAELVGGEKLARRLLTGAA